MRPPPNDADADAPPSTSIQQTPKIPVAVVETSQPATKSTPRRLVLGKFEVLAKIGEGTFGQVFVAQPVDTFSKSAESAATPTAPRLVAIKKLVFPYEQQHDERIRQRQERDGIPVITYRETKILRLLHHPNVMELVDILFLQDSPQVKPKMYFVFPYMDHDLAGLIQNRQVDFSPAVVKCFLKQILDGVRFLHFNNIIHRDMKPANLLINNDGVLKIGDFGLARPHDVDRQGNYTPNVVTRWYRAPELCLGTVDYTTKIDVWSVGCIFGEMLTRQPILQGQTDLDQLWRVFRLCGTPSHRDWPEWRDMPVVKDMHVQQEPPTLTQMFAGQNEACLSLLEALLTLNPKARVSADLALDAEYLWQHPLPAHPSQLPKYQSSHEYNTELARQRREMMMKARK